MEEEEKNEEAISYKEISCSSFEEAVEKVVAEENYNRIILCDIDGVLFGNKDKIPLYSLIKKSDKRGSSLLFYRNPKNPID